MKILFLAANPTNTTRLRLDAESRAIDQALRQAEFPDQFEVEQYWAVRVTELQRLLRHYQPDIVHFSGHGNDAGAIILEDKGGNSRPVSVRALSGLFSELKGNVRCVVLNGCYSEEQAQAIAQHIDCVVGMPGAIGAIPSTSFAAAFYQALGYGRDVKQAFDLGCLQIGLASLAEEEKPRLLTRGKTPEEPRVALPCPYPGMRPFSEDQRDTFFGRDAEIQEAVELLLEHPFLTVIGPAGSGKSSLVFAGVLPALRLSRRFGPEPWVVQTMRPGKKPLATFNALLPDNNGGDEQVNFLLIIDQFEETFTRAGDETQPFQQELLQILQEAKIYVILTVRADFYPDLTTSLLWPQIKAHRLALMPLGKEELRQAIVRPAETVGVAIETALVERLLDEAAGEPGVQPLVQETLVQLWEHLEHRCLPLQAYEALVPARGISSDPGRTGFQMAVARWADVTLGTLSEEGQAMARRVFLRLVQFGEGRADTCRQQSVTELQAVGDDLRLFDQVLRHLTQNRLLSVSSEETGQTRDVDIAHEALIHDWPQLKNWIREYREAEQTRRRLESAAERFVEEEGQGKVLDAAAWQEADRWLQLAESSALGSSESLQLLVSQRRKRQGQSAIIRYTSVTLVLLMVAVSGGIYFNQQGQMIQGQNNVIAKQAKAAATQTVLLGELEVKWAAEADARKDAEAAVIAEAGEREEAERQRKLSLTRQLAAQTIASIELKQDIELSLLLAVQSASAMSETGIYIEQVESALRQALAGAPKRILRHGGSVTQVIFSADGRGLATASADGTARLIDTASGEDLARLQHGGSVTQVNFSADGSRLATRSVDGMARLIDTASGEELTRLRHEGGVNQVIFSATGRRLATASADGTARLFDTASGEELFQLQHGGSVNQVVFSANSRGLATASADGTARLFDTVSGEELFQLQHEGSVNQVVFSATGHRLATASADGTARLFDTASGEELSRLQHEGSVNQVVFSADGSRLVTVSGNILGGSNTARLFDTASGEELGQLQNEGSVNQVVFSADGRRLATASADGMARLIDSASGEELARLQHEGSVTQVIFSADGRRLATASADGTARLFDSASGEELARLQHEGSVTQVIFSVDGRRLATASADGTARLFDTASGDELAILQHEGSVNQVVFSADGSLATASADGTARLFDTASGNELAILQHEDSVTQVVFNTDGRLATASADGAARLWRVNMRDLVIRACQIVSRDLTDEEWEAYVGNTEPDHATCPELSSTKRRQ